MRDGDWKAAVRLGRAVRLWGFPMVLTVAFAVLCHVEKRAAAKAMPAVMNETVKRARVFAERGLVFSRCTGSTFRYASATCEYLDPATGVTRSAECYSDNGPISCRIY